jgi:hypothetical protein
MTQLRVVDAWRTVTGGSNVAVIWSASSPQRPPAKIAVATSFQFCPLFQHVARIPKDTRKTVC